MTCDGAGSPLDARGSVILECLGASGYNTHMCCSKGHDGQLTPLSWLNDDFIALYTVESFELEADLSLKPANLTCLEGSS